MSENEKVYCPECAAAEEPLDRRDFIRVLGGTALAAGVAGTVPAVAADAPQPPPRPAKPAEALIKELAATFSPEQKAAVVLPWDHGTKDGKGLPTRLGMYNAAIGNKTIGQNYTKPQQELIERILRSIARDEEGYSKLTRLGTFDGSKAFENCGALIFGDVDAGKYAWVFTGHHLTVRCDGNSEEGAAFGGPMYYGHSPNGYSEKNCFFYQTKSVRKVFDALSGEQRKKAVLVGKTPGEQAPSVRFRPASEHPGISIQELSADQKALVEEVMRSILSPYRQEDVDEVMEIIKKNGGMDKIRLAFYQDKEVEDDRHWDFWRLEGPGFVWNYRVLPHVHTYVNISCKL